MLTGLFSSFVKGLTERNTPSRRQGNLVSQGSEAGITEAKIGDDHIGFAQGRGNINEQITNTTLILQAHS